MARRDVGPRDRPRTSADRPHISPLVATRKKGGLLAYWHSFQARRSGWVSGRAAHMDLASTGGSTMIGGTLARSPCRAMYVAYVGRPSTNVRTRQDHIIFCSFEVWRAQYSQCASHAAETCQKRRTFSPELPHALIVDDGPVGAQQDFAREEGSYSGTHPSVGRQEQRKRVCKRASPAGRASVGTVRANLGSPNSTSWRRFSTKSGKSSHC